MCVCENMLECGIKKVFCESDFCDGEKERKRETDKVRVGCCHNYGIHSPNGTFSELALVS